MKTLFLKVVLCASILLSIAGCKTVIAPGEDQLPSPNSDDTNKETNIETNIKVAEPLVDALVTSPLTVKGEARVFENQFSYELLDEDGSVLAEGQGVANAADMGQFGPFEIKIEFSEPKGQTGILNVFDNSAKDGSRIDEVKIPVKFAK